MRWLLLLIFAAPLQALAVQSPGIELHELRAEVVVSPHNESIRAQCSMLLRLHNPGAQAQVTLTLPLALDATLKQGDTALARQAQAQSHLWQVNMAAGGTLDLSSSFRVTARHLPHLHVLGKWRVEFPLQQVAGFSRYPAAATLVLRWDKLPPEQFGAAPDDTHASYSQAIRGTPARFNAEFLATTPAQRLAQVQSALAQVQPPRRTHDNHTYTSALITLAELQTLAADNAGCAETCAELARLESAAGRVISHCGPWARWRKHVPWRLRHVAALARAGKANEAAAREAIAGVSALWRQYSQVRDQARPHADFAAGGFGSYWDYDWQLTRALYADALDLAGERDLAARIRAGGDA